MGNEKQDNIIPVTKRIEKFKIQELQNYRKSRCLDHPSRILKKAWSDHEKDFYMYLVLTLVLGNGRG